MSSSAQRESGLPNISIRSADGATADVHLQGAHVTSWRPAPDGEQQLFLSARSEFRDGVAIRGGIPVIFPQFSEEGPLPRHGFARTSRWTHAGVEHDAEGDAIATFLLADTPASHAIWPASFLATLTVRVGGAQLSVSLSVENAGADAFTFTAALHTYLRVHDVRDVELIGLHGGRYRESAAPGEMKFDTDEVIRVRGEIDRVYVGAPSALTLREPGREVVMTSDGFPDVVVWNPGSERAAAFKDMEPGGDLRMLCVEAAAVQTPIVLEPSRRWSGSQTLRARARDT